MIPPAYAALRRMPSRIDRAARPDGTPEWDIKSPYGIYASWCWGIPRGKRCLTKVYLPDRVDRSRPAAANLAR